MKKISILFAALFLISSAAMAQFRIGGGLDTNFDLVGIGAKVGLQITDDWGAQVGYNFYLNSPNPTRLDIDALYTLTTAGDLDEIMIKGLGGFNYWNSGVDGVSSELGINVGGNISFPIEDLTFYIEPRVTIISNAEFFVGAGVYF